MQLKRIDLQICAALLFCALWPLSSSAFQLISFNGNSARWSNRTINYIIDARGSKNFKGGCDSRGTCVSETQAIRQSFSAWNNIEGIPLTFVEGKSELVNKTGFDNKNHIIWVEDNWTAQSFSPPSGALAVTISTYRIDNSQILDSDIHFNGEHFNWAVIDSPEEKNGNWIDIQNIATHEIGHFLGLDHSSESINEPNMDLYLATMYYASGVGETFRRELKADDIAAIKHLYHEGVDERPQVDTIYPDQIDTSYSYQNVIKITGRQFMDTVNVRLVRKSSRGDINARIVRRTDSELEVDFDLYGLPAGKYDLIVANGVDQQERLSQAITIASSFGPTFHDGPDGSFGRAASAGGCSAGYPGTESRGLLLLMCLAALLVLQRPRNGAVE